MTHANTSSISLDDQKVNQFLRYANETRKAGLFNDINVQVGSKRFSCNKLILACYSTYFRTMFQTEMQEKYQDTVELLGFEDKQLYIKMLIDYMYGEQIAISEENVLHILRIANYLQIIDVKASCFEYISENINVENCLDTLAAYKMFVPDSPPDHVHQFIGNNFAAIMSQEKFKSFSVQSLSSLLEHLKKKHVDQELSFQAVTGWVASDQENRIFEFASLFALIDLSQLSPGYLDDVVTKNPLVKQNAECLNPAMIMLTEKLKYLKLRSRKNQIKTVKIKHQKKPSDAKASKILCLGGNQEYGIVDIFLASDNTIQAKLPLKLEWHSSAKFNNFVFCIGGISRSLQCYRSNGTNRAYRMDLSCPGMRWSKVARMRDSRHGHCSTCFEGKIVVSGGCSTLPLDSVESYDTIANKWKMLEAMKIPRGGHEMVVCDECLYVLGGNIVMADNTEGILSAVERLNNLDGKWEYAPSMKQQRYRFAAVCLDEVIYAIGGQSVANVIERSVEKFDKESHKWSYVSDMNSARWGHAACVFEGKIYVVGGRDQADSNVLAIESYDPATDTWTNETKGKLELLGHSLVAA